MKKFILSAAAAVLALNCAVCARAEERAPALSVEAKAAILVEPVTGKVLFERNADERLAPASVTKVMTILLIYEAVGSGNIKWGDVVTVSEHAAGMGGSQIFLEPYEKQTVRDLTKSIVIASANDAAVAMAEFVAGSEETFVGLMNDKARALGAMNTNFQNACGLDADGHYTSARDLALFTREIMLKYPEVFDTTRIWQDSIVHRTKRGDETFGLTNTNKLIKWYNGATGLKTGSTGKALYCLAGTASKNGMDLIAVVLGAPTPDLRFGETMKMLDYGYANYRAAEGLTPGTVAGEAVVRKGRKESVSAVVKEKVAVILPKNSAAEVTHDITFDADITAPVSVGQRLGEIVYRVNGEEAAACDLVSAENVDKAQLQDTLRRLSTLWFR